MTSFTHNFFATSAGNPHVTCNLCGMGLKCRIRGSNLDTSSMVKHLRRKHAEDVSKFSLGGIKPSAKVPKLADHSEQPRISNNECNIISSTPDHINLKVEDLKLIHPFSLIISGPTSSGKSTVLFQILENLHKNIDTRIQKVVFIYGVYQEVFENYPNIYFTDNLDYMELKPTVPTIIVLDDVMSAVNNSKKLEELFTRGVHHRKVSVILTLQNLFYHGSVMKTLRDNSMYIILTRHIQDVSKLDTFARQLERKNSNYFKDSYEDAVSGKYGYIMCDLHPHSNLRDGPFKIKYSV